jgi:V8-like Glu-specific endopeptidase
MRPTPISLAAALSLGLLGCAVEDDHAVALEDDQQEVVGGEVNTGDPAAVLLASTNAEGQGGYCTGTVISPRIILTAGHCVDNIVSGRVHIGTRPAATAGIPYAEWIAHPSWSGDVLNDTDIALVLLQQPITNVTPIPLHVNSMDAAVGRSIRVVGFGVTSADGRDSGTKRVLDDVQISQMGNSRYYMFGQANNTICFGDSGGPDFVTANGRLEVAGVHSFVNEPACEGLAASMRVDTVADSFIIPWATEKDPDFRSPDEQFEPETDDEDLDDDTNGDDGDGGDDAGGGVAGGCAAAGGGSSSWLVLGLALALAARRRATTTR